MPPRFSIFNEADSGFTNAETPGDLAVQAFIPADFFDVLCCEFRGVMRFTPWAALPPLLGHVGVVVRGCSKEKVVGIYAGRRIAAMANIHPWRDLSPKEGIRNAMSEKRRPSPNANLAIPAISKRR